MVYSSLSSYLIFLSSVTLVLAYTASDCKIRAIGAPNTLDFHLYYERNGHCISAFHDIPLYANKEKTLYNMVVEIPRWTNAKYEINKEIALNPIKQDISKGKPRFLPNVYPCKGYMWNYGAFPQTWEDPSFISPYTNQPGDNDPIDVIDIGQAVAHIGEIKVVKVLGVIGLIDQNETDWKVVVIDSKDPLADKLHDISDVNKYMPGYLQDSVTFFKTYKKPQGGNGNSIAFDDVPQNKTFAEDIIKETHKHWKKLIKDITPPEDIQTINLSVNRSAYQIKSTNPIVTNISLPDNQLPAPIDPAFDVWYFVS
ncbi:inorganic pyrophosphatase [Pilobolus umbonatus]|nr:inorganic pyrophosphatase [Pilobolus umbonatus]